MARKPRQIGLFVEGDTERGDARRRTLPTFFRNWLDPQLPHDSRVGITAVKFHGVSDFLSNVGQKAGLYLDEGRVNFVFGLVDLYGIPADQINLSRYSTVDEKVLAARAHIENLIPARVRLRFRQYFAVHEVEAWLLAYPNEWPPEVRPQISKRPPEKVNFGEPPAKLLTRILGRRYKKTTHAMNLFPKVDPRVAIEKCPYLRTLADDLLRVARLLQ